MSRCQKLGLNRNYETVSGVERRALLFTVARWYVRHAVSEARFPVTHRSFVALTVGAQNFNLGKPVAMTDTLFVPELRATLPIRVQQSDLSVPYSARSNAPRLVANVVFPPPPFSPTIATFISAPLFFGAIVHQFFMQLGKDVCFQCCDVADMQSHTLKVERFRRVAQCDFRP